MTWRLFWRELRAGEFTLLIAALILAVTATTTLSFFTHTLAQAINQQAARLLAADVVVVSSRPLRDDWPKLAQQHRLQTSQTIEFATVAQQGDNFQLSSIKAVADNYPLRGTLSTQPKMTTRTPAQGTVWVEERLLNLLNSQVGQRITLGEAEFIIAATIAVDADMGGSFSAFSPKIIINIADVPKTNAIQQGSRVNYRFLVAGKSQAVSQFSQQAKDQLNDYERLRDIHSANKQLSKPIINANSYLSLASIASVLLAGIAVALAAQRFSQRHFDSFALMRCLGYSRQQLINVYASQLAAVSGFGLVIGSSLGLAFSLLLFELLGQFLPVSDLSFDFIQPLITGLSTALLTLIGFALPAFLRLAQVSPLRVMRRELTPVSLSMLSSTGIALVALFILLSLETGNITLTAIVLVGGLLLAGLLGVCCGWLLGYLRTRIKQQAFANLTRQPQQTIGQILALALGFTAVLLVMVLRSDLFQQWQTDLPPNTPNHFAVTIPAEQKDSLQQQLEQRHWSHTEFYPVVRGRLVAINGEATKSQQKDEDKQDNSLNRELNLTWTNKLPANNELVEGKWLTGQQAEVSVEKDLAERLKLKLGDTLSFQMAEGKVDVKITSLRTVDWDSFQPNFFFIFPEPVLKNYPASYLTSFYVPPTEKAKMADIIRQYPTIIFIDIAATLNEAQKLLAQLSQGILVILVFVVLAGCLVLIASLAASFDSRLHEAALLRALGAKRQQLQWRTGIELAILGLWAGLLAVILTEIITALISVFLLEGKAHIHAWLWLTPLFSASLVLIIGLWHLRKTWQVSPMVVLKEV
ncbi:MAG TPA: FtsX-like permease family protein [Agitococcus sp.]|nr:FtsX-like permease family protein [Agitococcus sp.]